MLLVLGWVVKLYRWLAARDRRPTRAVTWRSRRQGGVRPWELRLGAGDATLDRLEAGLRKGEDLGELCAEVQPAYRRWNRLARRAYRLLVETLLEERRRRAG